MTVLEVQNVVVRYGRQTVLAGVSFELKAGEIYGLAGPNGSGKSTVLRALCGLKPIAAGSVRICGHDLSCERPAALRKVGYVAQRFGLYPDLTVAENLRFYAQCYGFSREEIAARVADVLERFGLAPWESHVVSTLSHGWSQRVALAVATCHGPALLLLDETSSGLDANARNDFWTTLNQEAARGTSVLLATHDREDAERCPRRGRIEDFLLRETAE